MSKYYWTPASDKSLDEWLSKTKPTIISDHDTPFIYVGNQDSTNPDTVSNDQAKAVGAGQVVLAGLMKELKRIEQDNAIPVRAKKGQKSKKAFRDEALEKAAEDLKQVSLKYGYTGGKWLLYPAPTIVNKVWAQIARSVAYGPLKDAGVKTAKVAPTNEDKDQLNAQHTHLICVYFDNVYDLDEARKLLEILLTEHGLDPLYVKSDLYTVLDIDSNHPSKLRTTLWRAHEVIEGGKPAVEALREQYDPEKEAAYYAGQKAGSSGVADEDGGEKVKGDKGDEDRDKEDKDEEDNEPPPAEAKKSVSFDELNTNAGSKRKEADGRAEKKTPVKRAKSNALAFKENDMFAGSEDEDDE